ncbi:hypothetical protein [Paraburkholderia sacchari]|uniref:hypothetical protein n=1 Tax=Paraburkholderia sacchari TaxID=159450 RepID=UPI001BD0755B|nr:hypothetical protein [Paraburkholderia sacchari]
MGNLTKLDDRRVDQFIGWSQDAARYLLWQDGEHSPSIIEVNRIAWMVLKQTIRGDSQHRYDEDYDAAAAEHYMYIRFLAGVTGDPTCRAAPTLYAAKKLFDQMLGRLQSGQAQGGHPVLPSNPYIVAWGQNGVVDGLADFRSVSGGAPYKLGGAVGVLAGFSLSEKLAGKIGDYAVKVGNSMPGSYARASGQ